MIKLDENTDSILPYGLKGTPFETVYKALQAVASTVWPADASGLRASAGWAWYALKDPAALVSAVSGKQFLQDVLISEQVPLVKSTQTQAELVDLLIAWLGYKPTFGQLEALYKQYAATVDIRPITDADTQAIYPVIPVHGAFYVIVTDIDLSRPLTLAEALTIAERATPMGSTPFVLYDFDAPTRAYAELGYGDVCIYAGSEVPADVPVPPQPDESPKGYIVVNSSGRIQHSVNLDKMFIHQIQHSVAVVNFYFTSNGAAETENSELESGVDVTLYNADGTVADGVLYDGAGTLTYTQANGNMFEAADGGDLISLQSGALVMSPNTDYKALSVQVEYISPLKEAYFTNQGSNRTSNYNIGSGASGNQLFAPDGNHLYASEYATEENYSPVPWTMIGIYDYSGNYVSVTNRYSLKCEKSTGYLCLMPDGWVIGYHSAYKVVYKES